MTRNPHVPDMHDNIRMTVTIGTDERLERAWAAMRWVYENGMRPDHSRPKWVSDAFSDAYEPVRRTRTASSGEGV